MKKALYIFSNTYLKRKDNTLMFEVDDCGAPSSDLDLYETNFEQDLINSRDPEFTGKKNYIPVENIDSIYAFGDVKFNSVFINFLSKNDIPLNVFNYYGSYSGTFIPKNSSSSGKIILTQSEAFNNQVIRQTIAKKILTCAVNIIESNLNYYLKRNCPINEEFEKIQKLKNELSNAGSINAVMGYEGMIRNIYYSCWDKLLVHESNFTKRISRPPRGHVNALISFGNVLMYSVCLNEILRTQLNPFIGFLHQPGDNKYSLAFDIAEIFKPLIIDKVIFRMLNLGMIKEKDFRNVDGFCYLKDLPKRKFVEEINQKLITTLTLDSKTVSYRTLIRLECYELLKFIKCEKEDYNPVSSGIL